MTPHSSPGVLSQLMLDVSVPGEVDVSETLGPSGVMAARVGAVVLLAAGSTSSPLKRVCLQHYRSPALFLLHYGERAVRSRFGALRVDIGHGACCIGCCWALMVVLLVAGVMSLSGWVSLQRS